MVERVFPGHTEPEQHTMAHALEVLAIKAGFNDTVDLEPGKLPSADRRGRHIEKSFSHTPDPLLASWRSARQLMASTNPGDVIVATDRNGLLGVFALMQAALPSSERRRVWTVAANSLLLELQLIAGAHSGLPDGFDHLVDWEIAQYRYSDRVLATSARAQRELSAMGIECELLIPDKPSLSKPVSGLPDRWWVPGAVSRRNQSGEVLRALTSTRASATLGSEDEPDLIWEGTTWDALVHSRELLGDRVERRDEPVQLPDVLIIGDPYRPPSIETRSLVSEGVPVVVPTESTAAMIWPEAQQWNNADDLARALTGDASTRPKEGVSIPRVERSLSPVKSGAQRISVGVPVFRDVRFLDQCIESLLDQELEPIEIIIIDDGSESEDVEAAFRSWESRDGRIHAVQTEHRGVCVARNLALEMMAGDSFVFVDSDDYLSHDHLVKCAEFLRTEDQCWAVASWTRFFGAYEGVEAKPPFDRRVGLRENPIVSTTALVDMKARDVGIRFEPDLAFIYCEDWHFWSQIVAAGGQIGLVPEPLAHHRVHQSSGGYLRTELAHSLGKTRATQPLKG